MSDSIVKEIHRQLMAEGIPAAGVPVAGAPAMATRTPAMAAPAAESASSADRDLLNEKVREMVCARAPLLSQKERVRLERRVLDQIFGMGPLEELLNSQEITEIMINGPSCPVWIEQEGHLKKLEMFFDRSTIEHLIEKIISPLGLRLDRTSPWLDARLSDGSRVHIVVPPLAVDGPYLNIRKFQKQVFPLEAFTTGGIAEFLKWTVRSGANTLITGGTGAGKTTLINSFSAQFSPQSRVITIEDAAELILKPEHVIRLESRPADSKGIGGITIAELLKNALRMRPDRLVVGEIRGAEALDMLQAMNTGHIGCLSTCHSNGLTDALRRLETLVLMADSALTLAAVRSQIASALDYIVHISRLADGGRKIISVAEVLSRDQISHLNQADNNVSGSCPGFQPDFQLLDKSIGINILADKTGLKALPVAPPREHSARPPRKEWLEEEQ